MRTDTTSRTQVGPARLAGEPQHRHQRHDARAAADEQRGRVAVPDEPAADRAAHLELSPTTTTSCRNVETSPSSSRSTVSSISFEPSGADATEYERDAW